MKILLLFTILISLKLGNCLSQDSIVIIHPVIGEIIDSEEKIDYLLFPEISNKLFRYGYIKHFGHNFYLHSVNYSDSITIRQIDTIEINLYKTNINKLKAYYFNQAESDSLDKIKTVKLYQINTNIDNREFELINEDARSMMVEELLLETRLKMDAERLRIKEQQGSRSKEARIEFHRRKNK